MTIVDAHTHVFPEEIVRNRAAFLDRDDWFAQLYGNERAKLATVDDLLVSMEANGVDRSIICGFPWGDPALCDLHNAYMQDAADRNPARIDWLAIVPPAAGGIACRMLDQAFSAGAVGAGEFNADAQGFDLTRPHDFAAIADICMRWDRPIMVHTSEPMGHRYSGKGTATPDKLVALIEAFPELRVVAAHWGGGLPFYELMPEIRDAARNVVYDSAASTYLYDHQVFETVAHLAGSERVMFATDFPVLKQGPLLRACRDRPWTSIEARDDVLGRTAMRVYRLEGDVE